MGAHDDGDAVTLGRLRAERRFQRRDDARFSADVDGRERIVEHEKSRQAGRGGGDGSGQSDSLALPTGDANSELADLSAEPIREAEHVLFQVCQADGSHEKPVVVSLTRGSQREILSERSREQQRVLGQVSDEPRALVGGEL